MTSSELMNRLLAHLVKVEGGTRQQWRRALGEIRVYSLMTHPHCNWDIRPSGSAAERAAIESAMDQARAAHPQVLLD
jgi:hypothetical protein